MTMAQHVVLILFWTVLGACVGSFLNVCVYRIPRRMSVLRPRSRCPRCGFAILARHNVPVLGWLILRGRCRDCRGPIPGRYPAVELGVGLLFASPYILAVSLYRGDPWEAIGVGRMMALLLASWTVAVLGLFAALVRLETRRSFSGHRAAVPRRAAAGCGGPASSVPRS